MKPGDERKLIIDIFAGGGGASLGIEQALGVAVDLAVNHDEEAIAMHAANHPDTEHGCADVWSIDPVQATRGRPVGLAWFSPDCTHFSRAKGGKPVEKKIRSLAWVVVRWARAVRPRIIILENVPEFREWGPLTRKNLPDKKRKGMTFHLWCNQLRGLGYQLESRELRACDFGAPTIRKRLFVIARCDGEPIRWPDPTHGPAGELWGLKPYRTAASCIDWSIPCPSIFERKKPLAENTLKRIARGIQKFVIDTADPFIIKFRQGATGQPIWEPMHTITAGSYIKRPAGAGHAMGLVVPTVVGIDHKSSPASFDGNEPLRTITQESRFALVASTLVQTGHGERDGQDPRSLDIQKPLGTIVGSGKHALVAAFLQRYFGESAGQGLNGPISTVLEQNHDALVTAHLMTNTTGHGGAAADDPVPTVTTGNHQYLAATFLSKFYGTNVGGDLREPVPTITGGGQHIAEVRAFLVKYFATAIGQSLREPAHTITAKHRLGLVTVSGQDYQIADIGLRMLSPRELARAQGLPDSYILMGTKSSQVAKIGNSVCPPVARALVAANVKLRQVAKSRVGA
jgi:DNA (cytosine-5)-methyltransferase 1